jgi:hypothetical protein
VKDSAIKGGAVQDGDTVDGWSQRGKFVCAKRLSNVRNSQQRRRLTKGAICELSSQGGACAKRGWRLAGLIS